MADPKRKELTTARTEDQFWMVWRSGSGSTLFQHYTYKAAQREAERLAKCCPGEIFYVLKAMGARVCPIMPVQQVKMAPVSRSEYDDPDFDEVPF